MKPGHRLGRRRGDRSGLLSGGLKRMAGEGPTRHRGTNGHLARNHGCRLSSDQLDCTLVGPTPITAMQGQTTDEAVTKPLTQNDLGVALLE